MKKAIELIRVSTRAQAGEDRASIPAQRAINRRTARSYGLSIVRSIELSDVSGAAVLMAPEIQELLILMNDPTVHAVVAREFSRLMRPENFSDYALLQAFADTNTVLYLPEGPIDFSSKTGRLMGTIRAAIAGMERTEILERVWSAKEEKRRKGGFAQSRVCLPFGVAYNNGWHYTLEAERVREAFRLFLVGETSYVTVGRKVGIDPYSLRVILRNPIYTGWRIIDKRRDPSPAGKYTTRGGRQGDRKKIARAPEDVIRIKVIDEPLVSELDFSRAQRIMDMKKALHWRTRPGYESRFAYRGILRCAICEGAVHTKFRRADYYVCKARHIEHNCVAGYMRRERLEPQLDNLFTQHLTDIRFLRRIVNGLNEKRPVASNDKLTAQLESLKGKRGRVLEGYFEGVVAPIERDMKLAEIEREREIVLNLLARYRAPVTVDAEGLAEIFSPFVEFDLLTCGQKRQLLTTIAPEVLVADYRVKGMYIGNDLVFKVNHTGRDSWRQQA